MTAKIIQFPAKNLQQIQDEESYWDEVYLKYYDEEEEQQRLELTEKY